MVAFKASSFDPNWAIIFAEAMFSKSSVSSFASSAVSFLLRNSIEARVNGPVWFWLISSDMTDWTSSGFRCSKLDRWFGSLPSRTHLHICVRITQHFSVYEVVLPPERDTEAS